jgi:hypothetical protein
MNVICTRVGNPKFPATQVAMVLDFAFDDFSERMIQVDDTVIKSISMPLFKNWLRRSFTTVSLVPPTHVALEERAVNVM